MNSEQSPHKEENNMVTNATKEQLEAALAVINQRYDGNIKFGGSGCFGNRTLDGITPKSKNRNTFLLRTVNCRGKGGSITHLPEHWGKNPRHTGSACWHAHGYFFDALFAIDANIWIIARGCKITSRDGNWEDWDAGYAMKPDWMSQRCDCSGTTFPSASGNH
jgi:hypothetical protein